MKQFVFFLCLCISYVSYAQDDSTSTVSSVDDSFVKAILDTAKLEKDSLDIPSDAIRVKVEKSTLKVHKKHTATSVLSMVDANPEDVLTFWKNKFKDEYALRLKSKKELLIAYNVNLLEISTRVVTMYTRIRQAGNQTQIDLALEVNKGVYIDSISYPADYLKLKNFLHNAVKQYYTDYYYDVLTNLQTQHNALLKLRQKVAQENYSLSQTSIKLNKTISVAKKRKLTNENAISKNESKLRLNEEQSRVSKAELEKLYSKLEDLNNQPDSSSSHAALKIEQRKMIEKQISKENKSGAKSDKSVLKATEMIERSRLRIQQEEGIIVQTQKEIDLNNESLERNKKELIVIEKKISIKDGHIDQVKKKIEHIY